MKHSPGPWQRPGDMPLTVLDARGFLVARVAGDANRLEGAVLADARLIAGAPELLEALRGLYYDAGTPIDVDALIRRIEGEECPHQRIVTQDVIPEVSTCLDCRKEWTK